MASCFQSTAAIAELRQLQSIEVAHAPGQRIAGLLLVAWMTVRMKCELKREGDRFALVLPDGQTVTVNVHEALAPSRSRK
ncbi:OpcA/G6PD domain-containing protein [Verrucomicrobium spinosum]|uniref:OpcA/G6PD domain-containing protein n=1 Tax=Verrucomicrobium spinosum TaxID=2736 RepID=UPI00210A43F6|nr:OpcA/G6PD domain-containing protein [Verrucomicrobium spinosum]